MADGPDGADTRSHTLSGGARPGPSLAERLGQVAHRLSWRLPPHRLRLRGRHPLKLLDVPADPIPGVARAGRALMEGRLMFGAEQAPLDALNKRGWSSAFEDHLQSFAWVRDLAAAVPRAEGAPVAQAMMRRWLAAHAQTVGDPAWGADHWGRRILFWAAYAPFFLDSPDEDYRKAVLNTLARGARHLDRAADTATSGLPRVAAWAGVIAAGLLIPGGDLRVNGGEAGIARALSLATHADGGLVSRSPLEQLCLIELLAQLRAVYEVRARPPCGAVTRALAHGVPALAQVRLGDGGLSSWGCRPAGAARVDAAVAAAAVRAVPPGEAREWGYQRLEGGHTVLVMDGAPPPAGALGRHSGASTLAFELSDGPQRLVVNCGGVPGLPHDLSQGLRTTAAHSTLTLNDINSTALHDDGTMGRGVTEVELLRTRVEAGQRLEAAHDGYLRRFGLSHRRRVTLAGDGGSLEGEDRLTPASRRRGAGVARPAAIRFHLGPEVAATLTDDGQGALLQLANGPAWQFRTRLGMLAVEPSLWVDPAGRPRQALALVVSVEAPATGVVVPWSFRREPR
jgi:uncharacterized heparinase superfamily protein